MEINLNTEAYYNSALKLGLNVQREPSFQGFTVFLANKHYHFSLMTTPYNSGMSFYIANNKFMMNRLLKARNIPVPESVELKFTEFSLEKLLEVTKHLIFPLVVKPKAWTSYGTDVICGISDMKTLFDICETLFKYYPELVIEEYYGKLNSYRVLIFKNKILDVLYRQSARVTGDGKSTITQLVEAENLRRKETSSLLQPIGFNLETDICLKDQKLTKDNVPKQGKKIILNYTVNTSRGGTIKSYTGKICPENLKLFKKITTALNLELAGIDIECKSLELPIEETSGVIIEANPSPSVRIHEEGIGGKKVFVTRTIMRSFIYMHPFGYLWSLLRFKKAKWIVCGLLSLSILASFVCYIW